MDFVKINQKVAKNGTIELGPSFIVTHSKDLLVKGGKFYAIWDEANNTWSTDIIDVQRLVDQEVYMERQKVVSNNPVFLKTMSDYSSNKWTEFDTYLKRMPDSKVELDTKLIFSNMETTREDHSSKKLSYPLEEGDYSAYDELISTLYSKEEREKLEWAIGSIVAGDGKDIQKFIVLYGESGAGKSTVLNIIQKLFDGYYTVFDAKSLGSNSNQFSTEMFKNNPLVAIQHDGDLSDIRDNTKLNSIISHEFMTINEKFKNMYIARSNCFLFMATNKPVKITDAKSGLIRRLIDVRPTGKKVSNKRYFELMNEINFELGAIASHCLDVYRKLGKYYYDEYRPLDMMFQTDLFFNFVEENFGFFCENEFVTLAQAYELYKQYCDNSSIEKRIPKYRFREELKNYFAEYLDETRLDDKHVRSVYTGFLNDKFKMAKKVQPLTNDEENKPISLTLEYTESLLDDILKDCPAQYANRYETPSTAWDNVETTLKDVDTSKVHYVLPPKNLICIDFDLKNEKGDKDRRRNLEAASLWKPTYAEYSKGGSGIHLYYWYTGDVEKLQKLYSKDIEVKTFVGKASLRRKVSKCNNIPIATLSSGLPLKEEKKDMISEKAIQSVGGLRRLINRCLKKEFGSTTENINFIKDILDEMYESGMPYDVTDMYGDILAFAIGSTHQSANCCKKVDEMKFKSAEDVENKESTKELPLIFFDVEVYPNLFVVVYKEKGKEKIKLFNPKPIDILAIIQNYRLIGFNCRRYDNHIMYARSIGYSLEDLFNLSQNIINAEKGNKNNAMFLEAYNLSYTDIYDYMNAGEKASLKKWEIKLGIHHQEMDLPWDKPVPKDKWELVADYCGNDVDATEATFYATQGSFAARKILAAWTGMTVNDTTNTLTTRMIFGKEKNPQSQFFYRNLAENGGSGYFCYKDFLAGKDCTGKKPYFPGYVFDHGKSTYRGEEIGEGGRVYAEPGMYENVDVEDVASMHPHSILAEMLFGPYTEKFRMLVEARVAIKHKDFELAKKLLPQEVHQFLNEENAKALADALKTAINSVYGLTSARFSNPFKDPRNIDNIVAKRGALFMTDLKFAVQEKGYTVAHIKTDSIKIPNATPEIIEFIRDMGKAYGYSFETESRYSRMCLVNDAVYIALEEDGKWEATGTQFAVPFVYKTLFSHEPLIFSDFCETKSVTTALYLDFNEDGEHHYQFVGRTGLFCPIRPGHGGGILLRDTGKELPEPVKGEQHLWSGGTLVDPDSETDRAFEKRHQKWVDTCHGKYASATGSKDYRWMEAEVVKQTGCERFIDISYYEKLAEDAIDTISEFGDFDWFANGGQPVAEHGNGKSIYIFPNGVPCGDNKFATCYDCPSFKDGKCGKEYNLNNSLIEGDN